MASSLRSSISWQASNSGPQRLLRMLQGYQSLYAVSTWHLLGSSSAIAQLGPVPVTPRSKILDFGFLKLAAGTDPVVDIVAIHGLDGHREKTWTSENGILWLRDLLPAELPNARVLAYGYDADTRSHECVSTQTIRLHAESFLRDLTRIRDAAPQRPIIFVAHSLGGIILKQALGVCNTYGFDSPSHFRDILVSTHAILFFGTPHSGTSGVELLQFMNRLASVFMKTNDVVLQHLKVNSPELDNIQKDYLSASGKIDAIFFYEAYATPIIGGRSELIVPRHSATIPGAAEEVLHADHCQMVKFVDRGEENFKKIISYIKKRIEDASEAVAQKWVLETNHRDIERGDSPSSSELAIAKPLPPISRGYIERLEIQMRITQVLLPTDERRQQPRCILYGIGGAGKTQLATNWVREHTDSFTRIIVVDGSSQARLEADLQRSIRSVSPEYRRMTWKDAVAYLDSKERGWLLFIDNMDSPDLNLDLDPYLPTSSHGAILITTRNSECSEYAPDGAIQVGDLEEDEALNLLHKVSEVLPVSRGKSLEIVKELGMLALAITQAGAYIHKTRRLDTYLETFQRHRSRLLREKPARGTKYSLSIYAAFDMSFHQLPTKAQEFMRICAFLHHSLIPVELFKQSVTSGFDAHSTRNRYPPSESDEAIILNLKEILGSTWDDLVLQDIVDPTARASFITISTDNSGDAFYNVHPLVQLYIKDDLAKDQIERYTRMTTHLLLGAILPSSTNAWHRQLISHVNNIPHSAQSVDAAHALTFFKVYESVGDWKRCRSLLEFAHHEAQRMYGRRSKESLGLLSELATITTNCGVVDKEEQMRKEVLDLWLELSGRHHPEAITALSDLAVTLYNLGRLEEAEEMSREVLNLRLEVLGGQHPAILTAKNDLANVLHDRGRLDEAEVMRREVLSLRLERLGKRHLHTILAMQNLAVTLYDRGQLAQAEQLQRSALTLYDEILGRHHPETLMAMNDLAYTLSGRGQLDEAEQMQREVLSLYMDALGRRHPNTITAMSNLAATLYKRGELEEAEQMSRNVLNLRFDVLGERHPAVFTAMNDLANVLYDRGQLDEAESLRRAVLTLRLESFGPRHLHTILAMENLAITLTDRGQLDQAEQLLREALKGRVDILGRSHPETIHTMNSLFLTLSARSERDDDKEILRDVLNLRLYILGKRHPTTITAMYDLAVMLYGRGRLDDAWHILREVVSLYTEVHGRHHTDTINAMHYLAVTLHGRGQVDEASQMLREVVDLRIKNHGKRHPNTITAMHRLASTLHAQGQLDEAAQVLQEVVDLHLTLSGRNHSDTVRAMGNLAIVLRDRDRRGKMRNRRRRWLAPAILAVIFLTVYILR